MDRSPIVNHPRTLSRSHKKNIEDFLDCFADIEKALKSKLGRRINDKTSVRALIDQYNMKNPFWNEHANVLRNFADIRNILTHQRGTTAEYPVTLTPTSLAAIHEFREHLMTPEPVGTKYRKPVLTVSTASSLADVLALAFQNGFSQFPIVSDGNFCGLITENEIMRWLGRNVKVGSTEINLQNVTVKSLIREKDPDLRGIAIFHFEKPNHPIDEVMGRFSIEPALEVILLTASGNKSSPIEGIITQWDAARYRR
jgi:predicted transcriptional regulator